MSSWILKVTNQRDKWCDTELVYIFITHNVNEFGGREPLTKYSQASVKEGMVIKLIATCSKLYKLIVYCHKTSADGEISLSASHVILCEGNYRV